MRKRFRRLAWAVVGLACLASSAVGQSRSLAVDDIVQLESFGRAEISPNGRWAVYEKRGAYDSAPRFDLGPRSSWAITDLWVVDLERANAPAMRLLPDEDPGLLRGAWSPSGAYLLVYRLHDGRLEVGIVTMADRSVRWTGITPEMPLMGAAFEWLTNDRLALVARADDTLPWLLRYYREGQQRLPEAWRRTALGSRPSRTAIETEGGVAAAEGSPSDHVLVVVNAASGSVRRLSQGRIVDFAASPDGSRIALLREGEAVAMRPDAIGQAEPPARQHLTLIEVGTGSATPVGSRLDVAPHLLRWSPDSSALLVWAREGEGVWSSGNLLIVDRAGAVSIVQRHGLEPLPIQSEISVLQGVRAEWMAETAVLYARAPHSVRFDWYILAPGLAPLSLTAGMTTPPARFVAVSNDTLYGFGDGAFWAFDRGGARRVTPTDIRIEDAAISDPEKPFRLRVNDPPRRDWAVGLGADGATVAIGPEGRVRLLGPRKAAGGMRLLAADTKSALVLERSGLVETLRLRTPNGQHDLDQVNAKLSGVTLPAGTPLNHPDVLGGMTRSWLYLPIGTDPASVKGMIVKVYPGSVESGAWSGPQTLTYGLRAQVLAGEGYAVLSPFVPATAAASPAVLERSVDAAVDAALEAYPELPHDRIVVIGHSFGGNGTLWIATRSDRYRAYVSWAGTSDMFGQWGEFTPAARIAPEEGFMFRNQQGWAEVGQASLGAPPWSAVQAYVDASPYLAADCITAPVLLIAADRDFVAVSQSERVFSALHRLGRSARLITYWGEEHMIWSPANIRDLYGEILDWIEKSFALGPPATRPAACSKP